MHRLAGHVLILTGVIWGGALRHANAADNGNVVSLAGEWAFRLDPAKVGLDEEWYRTTLPDKARLPGSTDTNGYGRRNTSKPNYDHLSRLYEYVGPAWYQREIELPAAWQGRRVTLLLERCHWETRVWLDERALGLCDSLCVPHRYELGCGVTPGTHRLTIRVDNTLKYDMGPWAHSTSEQTQTNWNGIVGRIELRATDPVWLDDVQVYPDIDRNMAHLRLTIGNATGKPVNGTLAVRMTGDARDGQVASQTQTCALADPSTCIETDLALDPPWRPWDEFSRATYTVTALVSAPTAQGEFSDEYRTEFGMRRLGVTPDKRLALNGRPIFLRGTLECCIFPLTGYPPTDVEAWLRIFKTAHSYGLNHMRFHSWCPPEAAFAAADQMGFLLHVEAPWWSSHVGQDAPTDAFIEEEVKGILDTYGNHPSFGMLCMGNEHSGEVSFLQRLVKLGHTRDPRHLYTCSTAWNMGPEDDYNVAVVRGLHGPSTEADFRDAIANRRVPIISHEVGQWTIYPDLAEMKKYTGVLRPRNFALVRDDLAARQMLDQAPDFTVASGKLMLELYKEEIEVLLRTPGQGGFQLLDLHDFPGQGTALVGTLDAFWDSKGLIMPKAFRCFCRPTVPLLRLKKRTFTTEETLTAQAEIAHFGPAAIENAAPVWSLEDANGHELAGGALPPLKLETGNLIPLGQIAAPLAQIAAPAKLTVTVSLQGTDISNDWDVWVYPGQPDVAVPPDLVISKVWDQSTVAALSEGKKVLVLASASILRKRLPGSFTPVFWSPVWFQDQPGTMGILCDPRHPALAEFPTEMYTNWQWYDLLCNSNSIILDDAPPTFRPVVQVIDNFTRNHKLGNLFEARVGPGKLMVCSIDLWTNLEQRPAARQLLRSILDYMASAAFQPTAELTASALALVFRPPAALSKLMAAAPALDRAVLHVKAAVKVATLEQPAAWNPAADEVLVRQEGFDYSVRGGTWRDSVGTAWHDAKNLMVTVTCPRGFHGALFVHFHDWNNLQRVADISFQGVELGTLEKYDGAGTWLAIPVTAQDTAAGKAELSAQPVHANVMITQIVLAKQ